MSEKIDAIVTASSPVPTSIKLEAGARTARGSLILTFAATVDGELLTMTGDEGLFSLEISGGRLDGFTKTKDQVRHIDAEDTLGLDDGTLHTLGITVDDFGTHVFVDGYEAFTTSLDVWTEQLEVEDISIDPAGIFDIRKFTIYNSPLTSHAQVAEAVAPEPFVEFAAAELSQRDARRCGGLTRGALRARIRARGVGQGGTIIAAQGSNGRLELELTAGGIQYTVFEGVSQEKPIASVFGAGHFDDGGWHDVILTSGRGALVLYVDGYQIGQAPGAAFFDQIGDISRVTVGMNLEGSRLFGEAQTAAIYSTVLSDHQVKRLAGVAPLETQTLFDTGLKGSASYRIPSLLTLESGVVLAGADQRVSIANDSPNDINFVLRRSLDGGKTFEDVQTLITYPGEGRLGASVIDSVLVQDKQTGRVLVLIDHFPGGIGQPNCAVGTGYTVDGLQELHDRAGNHYVRQADGRVETQDGESTDFEVDQEGNVTENGKPRGNIYLAYGVDKNESLFTARTSYLQMIYSDDDGATWSDPIDITSQVKADWMRFFGTSPGNGIQLANGRILIPVYYNHEEGITFSCAVIYTDDGGKTWHLGESPNDNRELFGEKIHSRNLTDDRGSLHESALVEGSDGSVHVYMRNQHPSGRVAHSVSQDHGETWGPVDYVEQLTEIFSQPNCIRITLDPVTAQKRGVDSAIVFANASRMLPFRGCGVLRLSFDDGKTWPHNKVFNPRHYVYQCMAQLPDGDIALLWERETQGLFLTRLPIAWLTESRSTIS
ncbi:sialidase family protein [Corynebacterium aquilae]|uniref:exo-alpha-sialidase n=1 Tax=Corynebacterium aquilae DSM 44791 TaxID=1431546 RepID=A0A1L7CGM6_9CORY|nr:sialidase family protein [Corynebacterium aquilae]APT84974.1 sialidase [Corynebacterium aquilae DSM 44791]